MAPIASHDWQNKFQRLVWPAILPASMDISSYYMGPYNMFHTVCRIHTLRQDFPRSSRGFEEVFAWLGGRAMVRRCNILPCRHLHDTRHRTQGRDFI